MILSIVFLVLFAASAGVSIYFTASTVKTPMIELNYKKLFTKVGIGIGAAIAFFIAASFGFYMWLEATPDALHVIELVIGAILFIGALFTAINAFILHYYGRNIPEKLDKWLFRIILIGFTVALFSLFLYTNGLAPYLTYPLVNGISFTQGFVTPKTGKPNIAFYALCILSGAILVYFLADHKMYKEYGEHGILECLMKKKKNSSITLISSPITILIKLSNATSKKCIMTVGMASPLVSTMMSQT